ncbi:hypothetical protein [Serratia marcescens]|uniref:Uncharacterized protein n=1 Tax=Serratia marcescens TaxID=615 RepID=A0ABD5ILV4_SERMA|nr:hypothetical protein [Serratia marcescens]MDX7085064.1 hypothetical protein [Serratia marcescens]
MTILGFIITIIILKQTKDIKKSFLNKARLPEIQNELNSCASNINKQIDDWEGSKERISVEFSKCAGLLDSLIKKLDNEQNIRAKALLKKLKSRPYYILPPIKNRITNKETAWSLYEDLSELNSNLSQIIKDSHWG